MKSNNEFIAGIYQKAELIRQQETNKENTDKVIPIHSLSQRVRRISTYAAGAAACFLIGVFALKDNLINRSKEASPTRETRNIDTSSVDDTVEPSVSGRKEDALSSAKMIQAVVEDITQQEDNNIITLLTMSDENEEQKRIAITVSQSETESWQVKGMKIVISVYQTDQDGGIAMVPGSFVYQYQSTEDGQKIYQAPDGSIIKESEIH